MPATAVYIPPHTGRWESLCSANSKEQAEMALTGRIGRAPAGIVLCVAKAAKFIYL
jgi:hypothetical protein